MAEHDDELEELRGQLRRYLGREASDSMVAEWDSREEFPERTYRGLAEMGLMGLTFDEELGGSGVDYVALSIVVEEIARASGALAWAYLTTVSVGARAIFRFGTATQRSEILPRIATGEIRIAIALSEPGAGSDLGALTTSGTIGSDSIVLNGQKVFTTGADTADYLLVLVRTEVSTRFAEALTFVLVPARAAGMSIQPLHKMAGQAVHTCEVFFDNVTVPLTQIVGAVGGAAEILFAALDSERVSTAAMGLGIAQGSLDKAVKYANERRQFGKPIIEHQAVGQSIADMVISVDGARLLTERAASMLQAGLPCRRESAVAKVAASEAGTFCAGRGMRVLGGYSYMVEYGMERYWRESKLYEIAAGTNEILRDGIARGLAQ